MNSLALT